MKFSDYKKENNFDKHHCFIVCKELNHGANWYYYESAIDIQEDYINGGMDLVLKKRVY